jgi:hypothetical protein
MSQSAAAAVKNASICSSVKPMVAKPAAIMGSVPTNDPEYASAI